MNLNLKYLTFANARLEILTQAETDLKAQFLELMKLREQLREAQFSADLQRQRGLESPRQLLSPQPPSVRRHALPVRSASALHLILAVLCDRIGAYDMDKDFCRQQARLVRSLADNADPFIKRRLLQLAEHYERRLLISKAGDQEAMESSEQ